VNQDKNKTESNIKRIALRLGYIAALFVASIWVYNQWVWPLDRYDHAYFLDQLVKDQDTSDVIYIGESSNFWSNKDSGDIREISKMIEHKSGRKVLNLSRSAYHMGIYRPLFAHFTELKQLKDVILTVNIRTFGPPCVHSTIETSLQKDRIFLKKEMPFLKKMKAVFSLYDNRNEKERDACMWQNWTHDTLSLYGRVLPHQTVKDWCGVTKFPDSLGQEDMPKRVLADHYVKAYGFNLNETNQRIIDLDHIALTVSKAKYNLHLLILSENIQWADSLAGSDMANLIRQNRDYIVNRYKGKHKNVHIIDNLETVPAQFFGEKDWTTEHYFWQGRALIADSVVRSIQSLPLQ
jgi:hypothetical protein